jgi:hypothetical protein
LVPLRAYPLSRGRAPWRSPPGCRACRWGHAALDSYYSIVEDIIPNLVNRSTRGVGVSEQAVEGAHGVALDELGDDIGVLGEQAGAVGLQVGLTGGVALCGEGGKLVVDLGVAGLELGDLLPARGRLGLGLGPVGAKIIQFAGKGGLPSSAVGA